ncbi:hypothetical protein T492DRAFT_523994 [Pavlovales sp. CCMP2436]|nr:hypothetical protein T492DRAFT_523994 [Pavlovales sp. CCMP2436]
MKEAGPNSVMSLCSYHAPADCLSSEKMTMLRPSNPFSVTLDTTNPHRAPAPSSSAMPQISGPRMPALSASPLLSPCPAKVVREYSGGSFVCVVEGGGSKA